MGVMNGDTKSLDYSSCKPSTKQQSVTQLVCIWSIPSASYNFEDQL